MNVFLLMILLLFLLYILVFSFFYNAYCKSRTQAYILSLYSMSQFAVISTLLSVPLNKLFHHFLHTSQPSLLLT